MLGTEADAETERRKIEKTTEGLGTRYFNLLYKVLSQNKDNAMIICNYVGSMIQELNLSDNYRKDVILLLGNFSLSISSNKNNSNSNSNKDNNKMVSFKDVTREDVISFLGSLRNPEDKDPLHKWIGTYNTYRIHLMRFFRWLYYPNIYPSRNRPKPPVVENISKLKRKEKSIYKPTDLWVDEDDSLFLRYCPIPRDRCYHAMSDDSACRPHELLRLRIKDVVFKITPDNKQYAEILVNGKTGNRSIPLINSIPYIKDWIAQHPHSGNPNSILLCGFGKSVGRKLNERTVGQIYRHYKKEYFPKLIENPDVPPEDKQKIRELLKKPWNPYIRRHSALTEKSAILKEHHLRQYAGWSPSSNMHLKYLHYFGNEASEDILTAYGIKPKETQLSNVLTPKQCPNCNEPNKPDSRFCAKCRMVLTFDAYNETLEEQQERESQIRRMQEKYDADMASLKDRMRLMEEVINRMLHGLPLPTNTKISISAVPPYNCRIY